MKLPDFEKFEPFNTLRKHLEAKLITDFTLGAPALLSVLDLEVLKTTGKDVQISDIKILKDGTLAYKNTRVLLHIRDIANYHHSAQSVKLPKFHLADCRTLKDMRDKNRFDRYVVSIRTDGKFILKFITNNQDETKILPLEACMNCLELLSYKNFNSGNRKQIRDNFSIDEYFKLYPRTFFRDKPTHTSADAPVNKYPADMGKISSEFRKTKNFICESCGVDLSISHLRKFLHTNHKNALKYDCRAENLEALCIKCHAEQPLHTHMKTLPDYIVFITMHAELLNNQNFTLNRTICDEFS